MPTGQGELLLEVNSHDSTKLRCQGMLWHLILEAEVDGRLQSLVHTSAIAKLPANQAGQTLGENGSASGLANSRLQASISDLRTATIVGRHGEPWPAALMRFCKEVLQLNEEIAAMVTRGCQEVQQDPAVYGSALAPSFCFRHRLAVGGHVPLHYSAFRLRCRLREDDFEALGGLSNNQGFTTAEHGVELGGFAGLADVGAGVLERQWEWRSAEDAAQVEGIGELGSSEAVAGRSPLVRRHIQALLFGIEGSAPLKGDFFGHAHTPDGSSKELSAFGKRKWRDYRNGGQEVPADLGGLRLSIDDGLFTAIKEACSTIRLSAPSNNEQGVLVSEERELFKKLLVSPDSTIQRLLEDKFQFSRLSAAKNISEIWSSRVVPVCTSTASAR